MFQGRKKMTTALSGLFLLLLFAMAAAMPPHPDLVELIENGTIQAPYALNHRAELLARGVDSPDRVDKFDGFQKTAGQSSSSYNMLCILVDFSDKASSVNSSFFDSLMFVNQLGSVRHYYAEVSYGTFDLITVNLPSSLGWRTAPQTYAWYCNGANGLGPYPQNCQRLTEDIVALLDPFVDFSQYDNSGNGYVDGLTLVHTGTGAEASGSDHDIWSHKWSTSSPVSADGKLVWTYSIQPEFYFTPGDMKLGVYCHEFGHSIFGLPDVYDTDYSSAGLGDWTLMAGGSWNGVLGSSPAHFDAWCRIQCGFTSATNVSANLISQSIPSVESTATGAIYRLWTNGIGGTQYFLIENRQRTGYDSQLPGDGLLIYHIDESVSTDNDNEWYPGHTSFGHYLVALEQADAQYHLEKNIGQGDSGDPFPGSSSKTTFSNLTSPSSDDYLGSNTLVAVANISSSQATMTADLIVSLVASADDYTYDQTIPEDYILEQNYPNPFNPTTTVSFELPRQADVELTIYNILGEKIETIVEDNLPPGKHTLNWHAVDPEGVPLASGVYLYKLTASGFSMTRKMMLLK